MTDESTGGSGRIQTRGGSESRTRRENSHGTDRDDQRRERTDSTSDGTPIRSKEPITIYQPSRTDEPIVAASPDESVQKPIFKVGVAEYAVTAESDYEYLRSSGLGSCIGVVLHDGTAAVTSLLHFMLPSVEEFVEPDSNPAKFGDLGIEAMIESFTEAGGSVSSAEAKLAGGARMMDFESDSNPIGSRNIEAAKSVLESYGVTVSKTDTGGDIGRTLTVDSTTGAVSIQRSDGSEMDI